MPPPDWGGEGLLYLPYILIPLAVMVSWENILLPSINFYKNSFKKSEEPVEFWF